MPILKVIQEICIRYRKMPLSNITEKPSFPLKIESLIKNRRRVSSSFFCWESVKDILPIET